MKRLITALFLLTALSGLAQVSTYTFAVEEAIAYALENNNDLEKSQLDQEIIQAQIAEVKGRALPQISGSGQFTDNYSLQEQQLPATLLDPEAEPGTTVGVAFGNRYQFTGGLSVQQQLLNFQLFSSIRSTKALEELRNLQTLQTTQDLVINVVQVYIQVQVTEKQIELLQENYDRTDNLIQLSQAKYKEGIIKKLDLNQLLVNRSNLNTQIEDAKYNRNEQLRLLKLYLALPMDADLVLSEKIEDRERYPIEDELFLESNLQYRLLEQQLDLSVIDQKLVRAEYFPTLSAFFNYNYLGQTNEFTFSGEEYVDQFNGTWGLSASIPIFDGFQRRKRLLQKELETEKLEEDREQLQLDINKDYLDAQQQLILSISQIESQEDNMELAQENYDGIKMSYNEGVAALTELLDAEFALREAQSNYLNALLQSKVAELRLLRASGQLGQLILNN